MDFKNSYRVEAVYFQKLKSDIDIAKSYIAAGATDEARAVLENLVDVDGAVLLLYRNIGECWAELANAIEKTKKELDALRDQQEQYHDELNEKIDEINNYIIRLINALDERLTAAEADIDDLQDRMTQAESDIDDLQERILAAESDIDDLEANKQDKLTPGFGIEIDANNEIAVDTDDVQEKLIAGQNITLTPDSTDPKKTVIDAAGGTSYNAGYMIDISNDAVNNAMGCFNMGQLATLFSTNAFLSNLGTNRNVITHHEESSLNNYKGIFISQASSALPTNVPLTTQLENFESNFDLIIRKVIWISNRSGFDLSQTSGVIYFRHAETHRIKCENGSIVKPTNYNVLAADQSLAQMLHMQNAETLYVPLGKAGTGLYVHGLVVYDILDTNKTDQEWIAEIGSVLNISGGDTGLIGILQVYGVL